MPAAERFQRPGGRGLKHSLWLSGESHQVRYRPWLVATNSLSRFRFRLARLLL
ncbi:hypothetical protein DZA65_01372 [Dickeya dianthicola]|nr:hypothetical protein DDI_1109 [Dickeya dianthicola RNS04.9]AYC18266.1 hypothetical protein DZA65_01372 [Dickeya dianthicola]